MESQCIPTTFKDNGDLLKKALLQFPRRYQYEFTHAAKVDLRRVLSFAASYRGVHMKHLFPDVDESTLPKAWQHVLAPERYQHLERENFYFERASLNDPLHPNRSCGRKFKKGEPIYRCVTCGKDDTSGICLECFDIDSHKNHDLVVSICQRENGGVCDCGDTEAWNTDFKCKHQSVDETPIDQIPEEFRSALLQTFECTLDYVVDVLSRSSASLMKDQKQSKESVLKDSFKSTLDQEKYFGTDWSSDKFYLMLYNDQNRQYRDAVQRISAATHKVEDYSFMVADEVNVNGRAKVLGSTDIDELIIAQKQLEATGLPTCIRSARDIFREEMCTELISWFSEICNCSLFGNYNIGRDLLAKAFCKKWNNGIQTSPEIETSHPGLLIDNKIPLIMVNTLFPSHQSHWKLAKEPWNIDKHLAEEVEYDIYGISNDALHGSRFQYLLYFDIRFWKSLRSGLHNLFNSILTSNRVLRSVVCAQYVDVYPTMLDLFFLIDREPEYSCMTSLTSQIFASPSNATLVTQHGDLTRFLAAAYGFLTHMHVVMPEDVDTSSSLSVGSFKNRKIGQVFFDMCCLLSKTRSFEKVIEINFISQLCDILQLFQGKPVFRREALEHVEYETSDYGLYFNMYSVTSSLLEIVAKAFLNVDSEKSVPLIQLVHQRIKSFIRFADPETTDTGVIVYKNIETIEGLQKVLDFNVQKNEMSFLHPMHTFLSWIIQYSRIKDINVLSRAFLISDDSFYDSYIFDYSLRVLIMLSQIKVGFWVRNGFSIRTQLHLYQSSGIRESGFKRDIYSTQLMLCLYPPKFVLSTILSRWSLLPWIKEDFGNHSDYDGPTLPIMVEECILFFIHLLSETTYILEPEKVVEARCFKEIIHCLCLKPLSHSQLCTEIPDFISHEKRFDIILQQVADFIPAQGGGRGVGVYKLKEEYYEQIDPFYIHYNSNKREEALRVLLEREAKKLGAKYKDVSLFPRTKSLKKTLFDSLFKFTTSKIFTQFIVSTLKFVDNEGSEKTETMLTYSLYLIHFVIEGKELSFSTAFCENMWSELRSDHNEPFYYESIGSLLYKFLEDETYSTHHSKIKGIFKSLSLKGSAVNSYLSEQVQNFDSNILGVGSLSQQSTVENDFERKKRLAKERKAKIMAKFKKQQCKFVTKNQVEENSTDTEMEESNDDVWKYPEEHCILCQMPNSAGDIFGVVYNTTNCSSLSRLVPFDDKFWTLRAFSDSSSDSEGSIHGSVALNNYFQKTKLRSVIGPAFPTSSYRSGRNPVVTGCGHGMHYSCYQNYLTSSKGRQAQITRTIPEVFESSEFICPLCKSLCNLFLPVLWTHNSNKLSDFIEVSDSWYDGFQSLQTKSAFDHELVSQSLATLIHEVQTSLKGSYNSELPQTSSELREIWREMNSILTKYSKPHFRNSLDGAIANTIKTTEMSLRGTRSDDGLVISQLSNQALTSLRLLIETKKDIFAIIGKQEVDLKKTSTGYINIIEENIGKLQYFSSDNIFEGFEELDIFKFMVSLTEVDGLNKYSIYRLGFIWMLIQTLATLLVQLKDLQFEGSENLADIALAKTDTSTYENLVYLTRKLRDTHPLFDNISDDFFESDEFPSIFYTLLVRAVTPFLRSVAIWSYSCCGDISDVNLDSFTESDECEADSLARYLNLPTVSNLLELLSIEGSVENTKYRGFVHYIETTDNDLQFNSLDYPGVIRLIDLPKRLDEVFNELVYKGTDYRTSSNTDPAICLFCGEIVQLQKKSANSNEGECNYHVNNECIEDVGIFLLPRHSSLLLIHRGNGSFHPIPYSNAKGDFDSDVRQGQVLILSESKYDQFTKNMWLQQNIPNYITRKLEGTLDIGGWGTL